MKIQLSLKNCLCNLVFYFPVLYMLFYMISDSLARNLVQLLLILLLLAELKYCAANKVGYRIKDSFYIIYLAVLVCVSAVLHGLAYLFHLDFYAFILLLLIFRVFSHEQYLTYLQGLVAKENKTLRMIMIYYALLLISIIFMNGLQVSDSWGITLPVLYGPFEIPHGLAYTQLIIYCLSSIQYKNTRKKIYGGIMILVAICSIWTGVRSGFVALIILMLSDYLSVHSLSKKIFVGGGIVCIFLYLYLFTDVLNNNPIMQKTSDAISRGSASNGREQFTEYIMTYYTHLSSTFEKIFGIGITGIRNLMDIRWGNAIHAHNDFVNVLVGYGIVGMIPFLRELVRFSRKAVKCFFPLLILGFLAYYNGLFMYVGFSPCIPILILFYRNKYATKKMEIRT